MVGRTPMTWDELFARWSSLAAARRRQDAELLLRDARKRVSRNDEADWRWLEQALTDPERKFFVSQVFRWQPVPARLLAPFVRAAVTDVNKSVNRDFLEPCVESFGHDAVRRELDELRASGAATQYWYDAAMYWMPSLSNLRRSSSDKE